MKSKKRHKIQNTTSQIYWPHCELCTVWSTIMAVSDHSHYMQPYRAFVGLFLILAKKSHLSICYSRLEEEMSDYTFCNSKLILSQNCWNVYAKIKIHILLNERKICFLWVYSILPDCHVNKQSQESFAIRVKKSLWTACVFTFLGVHIQRKNNYFHGI